MLRNDKIDSSGRKTSTKIITDLSMVVNHVEHSENRDYGAENFGSFWTRFCQLSASRRTVCFGFQIGSVKRKRPHACVEPNQRESQNIRFNYARNQSKSYVVWR